MAIEYKRQKDFSALVKQSPAYINELIRLGKLTTKDIARLKVIPLTEANIRAATRRPKQHQA